MALEEDARAAGKNSRVTVSILVLLEIALEDAIEDLRCGFGSSFNPCSIGNCSGRGDHFGEGIAIGDRFQSLFYWKLLWKIA